MAEYRRNLRGILAKNGPARPAEILGLNGPAQLKFGPDRPGPVHLNLRAETARPNLSSLRFTTLLRAKNFGQKFSDPDLKCHQDIASQC